MVGHQLSLHRYKACIKKLLHISGIYYNFASIANTSQVPVEHNLVD